METRLTRRPGQAGTRKYVERYGERLVCVRYLYDPENGRRHKTFELIVETVPWQPGARRARRRDEEMVAVRIGYEEADLRVGQNASARSGARNTGSGKCAGSTPSASASPTGSRPINPIVRFRPRSTNRHLPAYRPIYP